MTPDPSERAAIAAFLLVAAILSAGCLAAVFAQPSTTPLSLERESPPAPELGNPLPLFPGLD